MVVSGFDFNEVTKKEYASVKKTLRIGETSVQLLGFIFYFSSIIKRPIKIIISSTTIRLILSFCGAYLLKCFSNIHSSIHCNKWQKASWNKLWLSFWFNENELL